MEKELSVRRISSENRHISARKSELGGYGTVRIPSSIAVIYRPAGAEMLLSSSKAKNFL